MPELGLDLPGSPVGRQCHKLAELDRRVTGQGKDGIVSRLRVPAVRVAGVIFGRRNDRIPETEVRRIPGVEGHQRVWKTRRSDVQIVLLSQPVVRPALVEVDRVVGALDALRRIRARRSGPIVEEESVDPDHIRDVDGPVVVRVAGVHRRLGLRSSAEEIAADVDPIGDVHGAIVVRVTADEVAVGRRPEGLAEKGQNGREEELSHDISPLYFRSRNDACSDGLAPLLRGASRSLCVFSN